MYLLFRMMLWIPALGYGGFLMSGGRNVDSLGQIVTMVVLGALSGFLLALLFTIRQCRRLARTANS